MNNIVSIIVPIYNSEKYLNRCIDSLINQTYPYIEILLINDGSIDNSEKICLEYQKNDSSVKYIKKVNTGVSDTRNFGINEARGDIICFVDSDDYIENDLVEKMLECMTKYEADLVYSTINNKALNNYYLYNKNKYIDVLKNNQITGYCWNKLYKKDIIIKNKIKFNKNIQVCEDLLFNIEYLQHTNKIAYCSYNLYHYMDNQSSIVNTKNFKKWSSYIEAYNIMLDFYKNLDKKTYHIFLYNYLIANVNVRRNYKEELKKNKDLLDMINNNISNYFNTIIYSKYIGLIKKINLFLRKII